MMTHDHGSYLMAPGSGLRLLVARGPDVFVSHHCISAMWQFCNIGLGAACGLHLCWQRLKNMKTTMDTYSIR